MPPTTVSRPPRPGGQPPPPPRRSRLGAALAVCERPVLAGLGVVPVTLIAASTFGLDLRELAAHAVLPALLVLAALAAGGRAAPGLAGAALGTGLTATALYDLSRLGFMWAGVVDDDPIPHIGVALGLDPPAFFGYVWRYCGNGTGLALTFLALGLHGAKAGVVYGLAVCGGLVTTLVVSPHGQQLLFPLTPGTVVMALTGHAVFGAVLGSLSRRREHLLAGARLPARREDQFDVGSSAELAA